MTTNRRALLLAVLTRINSKWFVLPKLTLIQVLLTNGKSNASATPQRNSKLVSAINCQWLRTKEHVNWRFIRNPLSNEFYHHWGDCFKSQKCSTFRTTASYEESFITWISQLFSLYPHGLNKRREFRSRNRICFIIVDYVISIYSDPSGLAYYSCNRYNNLAMLFALLRWFPFLSYVIFCYLFVYSFRSLRNSFTCFCYQDL